MDSRSVQATLSIRNARNLDNRATATPHPRLAERHPSLPDHHAPRLADLPPLFRAGSPCAPPPSGAIDYSPRCRVKERKPPRTPGIRGRVAFAKGEVIFREAPYGLLPPDREDKDECVAKSNVVEIEVDEGSDGEDAEGKKRLGQFDYIGKLNHSCVPNCIWHWNRGLHEMGMFVYGSADLVLTAWRDIPKGEELTVCIYDDPEFLTWSRARRNQSLAEWYHFPVLPELPFTPPRHCPCKACAYGVIQRDASDTRLARYRALASQWTGADDESWALEEKTAAWLRDTVRATADLQEAREILEMEEKWGKIGGVWLAELQLWIQWADVSRAMKAAEQSREWYRIAAGRAAVDEYFDPIAKLLREDPGELDGWGETAEAMGVKVDRRSNQRSPESRKKRARDSHSRWRAAVAAEEGFAAKWKREDRVERQRKKAEKNLERMEDSDNGE